MLVMHKPSRKSMMRHPVLERRFNGWIAMYSHEPKGYDGAQNNWIHRDICRLRPSNHTISRIIPPVGLKEARDPVLFLSRPLSYSGP